ncbi:MAG: O-antigen ligase family protein [Lachnospiraceae bacterium]|nr:O-antigen ligase family protein [Lachnospiraceae bacterium]
MKLVKKQKKTDKREVIKAYITEVEQYVIFAYLFCMLSIFPLYYKEQYYKIGDAKFNFFWKASIIFILVSGFFFVIKMVVGQLGFSNKWNKKGNEQSYSTNEFNENSFIKLIDNLTFLDCAVFIYGICVCLSYAFSNYKEYAFKGASGWEMGLCSQLIFVAIYFFISRKKEYFAEIENSFYIKIILGLHIVSSSLVFLFGILHRFDIDPLGMYEGLNLNQKVEFLSTVGQATWFSSYVCTTFGIGLALFYISKKRWVRSIGGIYTIISFGILVTQNSDSAFISIAGIMLLLGSFSLSKIERWIRFLQILCLMWGTFAGIGILQKIFIDRAIPLDTLSVFFSQSIMTWVMFLLSLLVMMFYQRYYKIEITEKHWKKGINKKKNEVDLVENGNNVEKLMQITQKIYRVILIVLAIGIFTTIIFIYLNTKGYLLKWFHYQNNHQYLLFNYHWGSNRGSTWIITWQAFCQMPFYQKLFGVGPDSLSEYLYSVPDIHDLLRNLWGNMRLTNAHNEYLNSLICYGLVGLISWCGVLFGGIMYFYKKAKENSFMIGFALCIMGYACHNIFCYQQVCCTPFLFLLLGIGESLTKFENFNTIK